MIRPLNTAHENGMIQSIKREINKRKLQTVNRLIIAHCDSVMIDRLTKNRSDQAILVVALPQSIWAMDSELEQEMLEWAIDELGVSSICLVGHSNGGTPEGLIQVYSSHSQGESRVTDAPKGLFARVQQGQQRAKRCEEHFKSQMKHIIDIVKPHSTEESPVQVNGYFYRAESGVFCVLDEHDWHWHQQDDRNGRRGMSRKELVN